MKQIAADIAARNPELTHERDHDVREVLTDAALRLQCLVDRRVDARAHRTVLESIVDLRGQSPKNRQRVAAGPRQTELLFERAEQRRGRDERTRFEEFPV